MADDQKKSENPENLRETESKDHRDRETHQNVNDQLGKTMSSKQERDNLSKSMLASLTGTSGDGVKNNVKHVVGKHQEHPNQSKAHDDHHQKPVEAPRATVIDDGKPHQNQQHKPEDGPRATVIDDGKPHQTPPKGHDGTPKVEPKHKVPDGPKATTE